MAISVDPDQTSGAVWPWSTPFTQTYLSENLGLLQYFSVLLFYDLWYFSSIFKPACAAIYWG